MNCTGLYYILKKEERNVYIIFSFSCFHLFKISTAFASAIAQTPRHYCSDNGNFLVIFKFPLLNKADQKVNIWWENKNGMIINVYNILKTLWFACLFICSEYTLNCACAVWLSTSNSAVGPLHAVFINQVWRASSHQSIKE